MSISQAGLESPFYRVASRLLVFDEQNRLLVVENEDHEYEIPGGGWEHGETFGECLRREALEELGVDVASFGDILFTYRAYYEKKARWNLRLFVPATLTSHRFQCSDDMIAAKFVSQEEFLQLSFDQAEGDPAELAALIWPVEKTTQNR